MTTASIDLSSIRALKARLAISRAEDENLDDGDRHPTAAEQELIAALKAFEDKQTELNNTVLADLRGRVEAAKAAVGHEHDARIAAAGEELKAAGLVLEDFQTDDQGHFIRCALTSLPLLEDDETDELNGDLVLSVLLPEATDVTAEQPTETAAAA